MTKLRIPMLLSLFVCAIAFAQAPEPPSAPQEEAAKPEIWTSNEFPPPLYENETPEERMERIGLSEDPGPDPDPNRLWERNGQTWKIIKVDRENAYYKGLARGFVRPQYTTGIVAEIYRETPEHVWVWIKARKEKDEVKTPAAPAETHTGDGLGEAPKNTQTRRISAEDLPYFQTLRDEFSVVLPPQSPVVLRFEESSQGLPQAGNWRNSLDVADMNGDGHLDLLVPAQRGSRRPVPTIFLGDGKGNWTTWSDVSWPRPYDYGAVRAADFNRDGHMDIAVGAHLSGVYAALGDGKGKFTDASEGLPGFFTRRIEVRDLNGDGRDDIVALSEGGIMSGRAERGPRLRAFLNDGSGRKWTESFIAEKGRQVTGDWLTVGDFNGDRRLDVAGSSTIFSGTDLVYLQGKGFVWEPFGRGYLPFLSYYTALTSGGFTSKKRDDLILSFGRFWPGNLEEGQIAAPPITRVVGIERVSFDGAKTSRTPIVRWESTGAIWGLSHGDFDGDDRLDVVYWTPDESKLKFLLGDGKGGFSEAAAEGIELPARTIYDITVADVNRDGRDDVLLMFEKAQRKDSEGAIRVWLGQPAVRATAGR